MLVVTSPQQLKLMIGLLIWQPLSSLTIIHPLESPSQTLYG
jgi:hypothetical protein